MTPDQQERAYRIAQIAAVLMGPDSYADPVDNAMILIREAEAKVRAEIKAEADKRRLNLGPTAGETAPSERPRPVLRWDAGDLCSSDMSAGAVFWSVAGKCWVASWRGTTMDQDTEADARAWVEAQARAAGFDVEVSE